MAVAKTITDEQATKLRRAARKERKCFEALCDEKDGVTANAAAYIKAKKARQKILDEVESA